MSHQFVAEYFAKALQVIAAFILLYVQTTLGSFSTKMESFISKFCLEIQVVTISTCSILRNLLSKYGTACKLHAGQSHDLYFEIEFQNKNFQCERGFNEASCSQS